MSTSMILHCAAGTASLPAAAATRRAGHASALRRRLQCGGVAQRCGDSKRSRPRAVLVAQRRGASWSCLAAASGQASEQSIYAEDGPHGQYFEAVVTDFIRTRSGAVLKLLCTPRCAGLNAEQREFPVLMDAACATETASAADRGGLPAALSSLEDLHQKDVRLMYIDAFGAGKPASGAFFVYDLVTEAGSRVPAEFSESLGLAIRHQEPVRISAAAMLDTTAECLRRMQTACAQDAAGIAPEDVATLGSLASRWTEARASSVALQPASAALADAAMISLLADLRQLHVKNAELFNRL